MKKKVFIFILIIYSTFLLSQTTIPVGSVSGTWSLSGSPYLIEGEIGIPDGQTLTIDPGCLIEFQGYYALNVQGRLLAIGSEQDSIRFTIADTTGFHYHNGLYGGWHGIRFKNIPATNDSSKIVYCHLEYGKAVGIEDDRFGGAIFVNNYSKLLINKSLFKFCKATSMIVNNFAGRGGSVALYNNSNIQILNSKFNNCSSYYGGGIYCESSDPFVENCLFVGNEANFRGGGISFYNSNSQIIDCIFTENSSIDYGKGGGAYFHACHEMGFISCKLCNNFAEQGGGIFFDGDQRIINCLITNNTASLSGGGITYKNSSSNIINCTIAKNEAPVGGGVDCIGSYDPSFINTIIYNNGFSNVNINDNYQHSVDPFFLFCDIEYGLEGFTGGGASYYITSHYQNCIESYPDFIDPTIGNGINFNGLAADYSINLLSPCINFGNPDTLNLNLPEFDLAGNIRIYSEVIDIGAYENFDFFTNFTASPIEGQMPLMVNFTDKSNGIHDWWEWDFESDGTIDSYQADPTFTYEDDGLYTVTLNSGNITESDTEIKLDYIDVQYLLEAEFTVDVVSGITPLTVNFTDLSIGDIQSWEWDFENDGFIESYEQNPTWEYIDPGIYSVKLTISDGNLTSESLLDSLITVYYQNEISGYITENTTLFTDTVNVVGDVTVLDGVTLTINPGVTMLFHDLYDLNIQGRLLAEGTEQDSIYFTALDTDIGWHGVRFDNTPATNDSSIIVFCKFEHGKAIGDNSNDEYGGGLFVNGYAKIQISNCIFSNNYAQSKGGAFYDAGGLLIDNVTFTDNQSNGNGGGIYTASNTILSNCIIVNNQSGNLGGGIFASASMVINNCNITYNQSDDYGGGIHDEGGLVIENSIISYNQSNNGGGIYTNGYPSGKFTNLIVNYNSALSGGGLYIGNNPEIIHCKITNNQSSGIYIDDSSPKVINSLVCNNGGNGIYIIEIEWAEYNPKITNCTIANNEAYGIRYYYEDWWWPNNDGAIKKNHNDNLIKQFDIRSITGKNNIFSGNLSGSVYSNSSPNLTYCAFSDDLSSFAGLGCISTEPHFVDPTMGAGVSYNALEADWSLQSNSMCINHGTPDTTGLYLPDLDLAGNSRVFQGNEPRIDIGAYEFQGEPDQIPDIYVYPSTINMGLWSVEDNSNEKSFTITNFGFIDLEISSFSVSGSCFLIKRNDALEFGSVIEPFSIEPDSTETINIVFIPNAPIVFNENITIVTNDPDESISHVNLIGTGDANLVIYHDITNDSLWEVDTVKVMSNISIENNAILTIAPGTFVKFMGSYGLDVQGSIIAEGTQQDTIFFTSKNSNSWWKGIVFDNTPATNDSSKFSFCEFTRSYHSPGGVFYIYNFSKIQFDFSTFANNKAVNYGGAMYAKNCNISISDSQFLLNEALPYWDYEYSDPGLGGGLYILHSNVVLTNCIIRNNHAHAADNGSAGGGIYLYNSEVLIQNSQISNNLSSYAVGIAPNRSNTKLINCELSANGSQALGLYHSNLDLVNSIISQHNNGNQCTISARDSTNISLINTIMYDNEGYNVRFYASNNTFYADYSCIEGGENSIFHAYYGTVYWEENNIDDDPLFIDPENSDFHLQSGSPCINTGTPSSWMVPYLNQVIDEILGYSCIDKYYDIGYYEYQAFMLDQNEIDFGDIPFNTTSQSIQVTITNVGCDDVLITSIEATENFLIKQNIEDVYSNQIGPIKLVTNSEDTFWIACHPLEDGSLEGEISIHTDAIPSLATIDVCANVSIIDILRLFPNYPNPFNTETTFKFLIPDDSFVRLTIFNIKGQKVKILINSDRDRGFNTIVWHGLDDNGKQVGTGVYFYNLNVNNKSIKTKKMLLIK